MSMTKSERVTFSGTSTIDDKTIARFSASIDPAAPENVTPSMVIIDKVGYRDNRKQVHEDQAAFEDDVYAAQAEMMETNGKVSETA